MISPRVRSFGSFGGAIRFLALVFLGMAPMIRPAHAFDATPAVVAAIDAYDRGDLATAFRLLSQEAARGNSEAQVYLGYLYNRGDGTPRDKDASFRMDQLSAAQGNPEGMMALGYKYNFGVGVKQDIKHAISLYCEAIALGNPQALNNLAIMLDEGVGFTRDVNEARFLWSQAAERGSVNSAANIGFSYFQGPAVELDWSKALYWLRRAAMQGHVNAQKALRLMGDSAVYPSTFDGANTLRIQPAHALPAKTHVCGPMIS